MRNGQETERTTAPEPSGFSQCNIRASAPMSPTISRQRESIPASVVVSTLVALGLFDVQWVGVPRGRFNSVLTSFSQAANILTTLPTHMRVSRLTRSSCLPRSDNSCNTGAACESNTSLIPASPPDVTHLEKLRRSSEAASWSATLVKYALGFLDEAAHNFGGRGGEMLGLTFPPSHPPSPHPLDFHSQQPNDRPDARPVPLSAPIRPSPPLISSLKLQRWTCHLNGLRTRPRLLRGEITAL